MKISSLRLLLLPSLASTLGFTGCIYVPPDYYPPGAMYTRNTPGHDPHGRRAYHRPPYDGDGNLDRAPDAPGGVPDGLRERDPASEPAPLPPTPSKPEKPIADEKKTPPAEDAGKAPLATKTTRAGRVKSPFPPYRELDVTGLPSGSLAQDPVSGKVFRVP